MATGICNPATTPFQFSSPPALTVMSTAFIHLGRPISSSLSRTSREPWRLRWSRAGHCGSPSAAERLSVRGGAAAIDQSEFSEKVLRSDVPVLVEFVADWCGPCRLMSTAIDWVSQEYQDRLKVVKMDHDENPQLIEEYKVYGLPTLILFKDGQEVPESRREGAMTKIKLKDYLDSLLESIAVA